MQTSMIPNIQCYTILYDVNTKRKTRGSNMKMGISDKADVLNKYFSSVFTIEDTNYWNQH